MHTQRVQVPEHRRLKLRRRTVVFGVLLLLFATVTFLAGLGIGVTQSGLPPERHPCLLVQRDDIPTIRQRLDRAPYHRWRRRLDQLVKVAVARAETRRRPAVEKAADAKTLAFAFVLTGDRKYGDCAAEVLLRCRVPALDDTWRSLDHMVQGTADLAIAYDLLAGYLRPQEALEAKTRLLLYELGDELYTSRYTWPSAGGHTRQIRQYAALGLCALAISDYEPPDGRSTPKAWYRRARERMIQHMGEQICRDGAYAEGPGRQFEAARLYIPFLAANAHVTGENLLPPQALEGALWSIRIRMPNGLRPNIDSSALTPSHSYALTWLPEHKGLFAWDCRNWDLLSGVPASQLPEALALYDDRVEPTPPPWQPGQTLEASGDVVFRSDWGPDATYLLLRAERGKARTAGGAYEQPDATAIVLSRGDEPLVLDSGFGGWAERDKTNRAQHHSLVLINDKGAPITTTLGAVVDVGVDVSVTGALFTPEVSAARAICAHNDARFARTVLSVGERHFFVADQALAEDGEHEFRWLLHVNAGEGSGGSLDLDRQCARVRRPGADLAIHLASPVQGASRMHQTRGTHFLTPGKEQTHTVLCAVARDVRGAQFLSVLSPLRPGEPAPQVTTGSGEGAMWATVGDEGTAWFRTHQVSSIGDRRVRTDGHALYVKTAPDGTVERILAMGATAVKVDGATIWTTDEEPKTVVLPPPETTQPSG